MLDSIFMKDDRRAIEPRLKIISQNDKNKKNLCRVDFFSCQASVIQETQKEELWYTLKCDPKLCHLHQTFMVSICGCVCVCVCVCACVFIYVLHTQCVHMIALDIKSKLPTLKSVKLRFNLR